MSSRDLTFDLYLKMITPKDEEIRGHSKVSALHLVVAKDPQTVLEQAICRIMRGIHEEWDNVTLYGRPPMAVAWMIDADPPGPRIVTLDPLELLEWRRQSPYNIYPLYKGEKPVNGASGHTTAL